MNNSQRKIVLSLSIVLAPVLFLVGVEENEIMLGILGPIVSIAIGIFVWAGRDKSEKSPDSE